MWRSVSITNNILFPNPLLLLHLVMMNCGKKRVIMIDLEVKLMFVLHKRTIETIISIIN